MPSHPEGLAIARVRIAEEKEKRTGFLDLGRLGLTELPEELFELEYLWGLNWGRWWRDGQEEEHEADSDLAPNQHAHQLIHLQRFPGLRLLSVSQTDISDLSPLAGLSTLQSLDCSEYPGERSGPAGGLERAAIARLLRDPGERSGPAGGLECAAIARLLRDPGERSGPAGGLERAAIARLLRDPGERSGPAGGLEHAAIARLL